LDDEDGGPEKLKYVPTLLSAPRKQPGGHQKGQDRKGEG
jgi:hypothetical protein